MLSAFDSLTWLAVSKPTLIGESSGPYRIRTGYLLIANEALYQLS